MKILVTGGQGFIGHNLIRNLYARFYTGEITVLSVDNLLTGSEDNKWEFPNLTYKKFDVAYEDLNSLNFVPDVIFHLAALARIQPSFKYPTTVLHNNIESTVRVLEFARNNGNIPVIFAGSSSVHSGHYKNPYTFSKWMGEEACLMYHSIYNLPITICRFYNVYGPNMIPIGNEYSTVIAIFEGQIECGEPLTITSDGEQRRDFTHVDDICDGLIACVGNKKAYGEIFELGRGENYSINEIAYLFGGPDYPTEYIGDRSGEARNTLTNSEKARELLGYNPTRNIEDYIRDFLNEKI